MNAKEIAKKYFPHVRILGDFSETEFAKYSAMDRMLMSAKEKKKLLDAEQRFFANSRQHGIDDSVYPFGIGGSDVAMIFNKGFKPASWLYEFKKHFDYYSKLKVSAQVQQMFDSGHFAEPSIRELFSKRSGLVAFDWPLQVVNPKYPHCIANIDGLVVENGEIGIYEGKWSKTPKMKREVWSKLCKYLAKDPKTWHPEIVPEKYLLQVYFYMAIYEVSFAYICGGWGYDVNEIGYTRIERLPTEIEKTLMLACEEFVEKTDRGIRPSDYEFENKKILKDVYSQMHAVNPSKKGIVVLDPDFAETADEILQLENEVEMLNKRISEMTKSYKKKLVEEFGLEEKEHVLLNAQTRLAEIMYDYRSGIIETESAIYNILYEERDGRSVFNKQLCESKYPEVFKEVYTPCKSMVLTVCQRRKT